MQTRDLETDRLTLRPWRSDDLEAFHAIWGDPEVIWWGANASLDESRDTLDLVIARRPDWPEGIGWFAVTAKADGRILGDVLLQPARFVDGIEIGWHFRRDAWGNGYATEAARRVLSYALDDVGLDRIYAIVATRNAASLRVVEKLGLERVKEMEYSNLPHVLFVAPQSDP